LFHCISVSGNGLAQEALNFRKWNDLVSDGVRGAKLDALQQPVNGDVRNAQNVRVSRIVYASRGKAFVVSLMFCELEVPLSLTSTRPVLVVTCLVIAPPKLARKTPHVTVVSN
jgi:hypothetical protein